MQNIVTFIPVFLPLILILGFKLNSAKTMTITLILFVIGLFLFYHLNFLELEKSVLNGLFNLTTPIFILLGALLLLNILEFSGALFKIKQSFNKISADQRIQVLLIGFVFSALIEGISGFGIPSTIAAPILISLGFKPLQAIILSLSYNSIPVSFGATGIPINFGLFEQLNHQKNYINLLQQNNIDPHQALNIVASNMIKLNYILIPLLLIITLYLVTFVFVNKNERNIKDFWQMLPLISLISVLYPSCELLVLNFIGFAFVSILTPIIMLIAMIIIIKRKFKFLIPNKIFHKFYGDKNEITKKTKKGNKKLTLLSSWLPYILVIFLLLIVRIIPQLSDFIQSFSLDYGKIKFKFLFNPGFTFIVISIFTIKYFKLNLKQISKILHTTTSKISSSVSVLVPTFILIEIFMNANVGANHTIAANMSNLIALYIGSMWMFFAPFLGLIGSFINGSATVSNISFGIVQINIAKMFNYNPLVVLTFQQLGANMGNMICISNIIVVCSIVGVKNKEAQILKFTMLIATILIIFAIIIINIF